MKKEIHINDKDSDFHEFIDNLPANFESIGDLIYMGRNYVRVITIQDTRLVIKSFDHITVFNRLVYATIRQPKATRSYINSQKLLQKGFETPEPVGYLNCFKNGVLGQSYYISEYTGSRPLFEVFTMNIDLSEIIIRDFARFTLNLHMNGIFHKDYNVRNVLYKRENNSTTFTLIDNNRMWFGKYSYKSSMRNLKRTEIPEYLMGIFADEYAKETSRHKLDTLYDYCKIRNKYHKYKVAKRFLRNNIKL